ncbi:hypothetical protein N2152v2_007087 [Parachlorella kessleri]
MGKSRGRGRGRGGRGRGRAEEGGDDELDYKPERAGGGQSATAGLLPPSDSEDEEDSEGEKPKPQPKRGQSATAGELPPSDSEDEDEDSEEDESEEEEEPKKAAPVPVAPRRKKGEEEVDPEQMRADMERLALIRKKREEDRLKRIQEEGFDRYAPPGDANRRSDAVPNDHPSRKAAA